MLGFHAMTGVLTGAGAVTLVGYVRGHEIGHGIPNWALVPAGVALLAIGAIFSYFSVRWSFALRWRVQAAVRTDVIDRARAGRPLALQPPLRARSTISLVGAAGADAAHTGWFVQLVVNGLVPSVTASVLVVAVGWRAPLLLIPIVVMIGFIIPLLMLQLRNVTRAAGRIVDSTGDMGRSIRELATAAIGRSEPDAESADLIRGYEDARFRRMNGVQSIRLWTGVLVAMTIGASVLGFGVASIGPAEAIAYVALLREGLSAIAGVARAAGGAARIQPRVERLRRVLDPPDGEFPGGPLPSLVDVHGLVPPDRVALMASICVWMGGRPATVFEDVDGGQIRFGWSDGTTCLVRPRGRSLVLDAEDPRPDLRLAIDRQGSVVVWNDEVGSSPDFGELDATASAELDDDEDDGGEML
jgi:ABC-type multidrug transport system fused ATPase/permease subunit